MIVFPSAVHAQIPDTFKNLQYFPEDISKDALIGNMRQFSFALGVRCQHCHAGGDGRSFEGVEFDSDEKSAKRNARYMLRMVETINEQLLPDLPERGKPNVMVECRTCHRGLPRPRMIDDILAEKIEQEGVEAAVAHYKALREDAYGGWSYDFGQWTINDLAEELGDAGRTTDAIELMKMNSEFYPESISVWLMLGDLQKEAGERENARESYERGLELSPNAEFIQQRLSALEEEP